MGRLFPRVQVDDPRLAGCAAMRQKMNDWWQQWLITTDEAATRCRKAFSPEAALQHRSPQFVGLEPRLLFSATPIDPGMMPGGDEVATVMDVEAPATETSSIDSLAESATPHQSLRELIFIDGSVPDIEQLLDDLNGSGRNIETFVLDAGRDGVDQITEILESRTSIESIHVVSHAENGAVKLGNVWLGESNLSGYAGQISSWQSSMSSDADILFYGCDLAADSSGQAFLESVSALTGADVAASDDDTGHARFDSDWDLEFASGAIETQIAFSEQLQENWVGKLATITVTTFADENNGTGDLSLREAIIQANAGGGGDTIVLSAGTYTLSIGSGDDDANQGDLDIKNNVTIIGAGATSTIIDGGGIDRVFELRGGSDFVTMSDLTIQGGSINGKGGGVHVQNGSTSLTLDRVIVQNNFADNGAGIFNEGTMTLTDVIIANNGDVVNTTEGGGIHNKEIAILNRVTISGNQADTGGGIHNDNSAGTQITLTNVTVSGNTAGSGGGGLYSENTATIINSTFTLNDADSGGGIRVQSGDTTITNTIVAGNTATSANDDVQGTFHSNSSFNLIGDNTGSTNLVDGVDGNMVGDNATQIDALLNPLADNGGFGETHSLQTGSLAINTGANMNAPVNDARGVARDAIVDIGAFELTSATTTKVYWGESASGHVFRANIDGTAVQKIVDAAAASQGLEVDVDRGFIYFISKGDNELYRANLDGSDVTSIASSFTDPTGIGIDLDNNKLYVADSGGGVNNAIHEVNLDTLTSSVVVNNFSGTVRDVAVDSTGGMIYFSTDQGTSFSGKIRSFDLVGAGGLQDLVTGETGPQSLEVDVANNKIYWADDGSLGFNRIRQADLSDGGNKSDFNTSGLNSPFGLDVNASTGMVYWSDAANNFIRSEPIGGGTTTDVLTGLGGPREIVVVTVSATNNDPTVNAPILDQTATQDVAFNFQFAANTFDDIDGNTLTYSATLDDTSALPGWLTFTAATRTFSGTPTNSDVGAITVRVTADDGNGGTVFEDFVLTVDNVNDDPTVDNAITDQNATQDTPFSFQFAGNTFGDIDGDSLTYTATLDDSSPLPGWLTFSAATRTFSGTPADADVGTITVRVTADDGNSGTVFDDFVITIADVNDAPTVALTPVVTDFDENADTTSPIVVATIAVTDDAIGTETLSLSGDDANLFEIVGNDLRVKAGVSFDFETNPVLDVTVNVDDATIPGTPDDSDSFSLTINNVTEAFDNTDEFRVNSTAGNDQDTIADGRGSQHAVSIAGNGSYVVVWTSLNQDGSGQGVYARRFDSTGNAITGEIQVHESVNNDQQWASVVSANDGTFVVTWTSDHGADSDVYFRRFSADGSALTSETLVNTTTSGVQENSTIAMNRATGDFVIAWQGNGAQTGEIDNNGIFAQRFDSSGVASGGEFRVNSVTPGGQSDAAVSMNDNGDFVVTWDDGDGFHFQRYDNVGNEQGGRVTVDNSSVAGNGSVAMHSDGSFVVVWREGAIGARDTFVQRFDNAGATANTIQTVTQSTANNQTDPSIAMDSTGAFVIVWEGNGTQVGQADASGVFVRRFNATATAVSSEFRVNDTVVGNQGRVSAAMIDIDNFVVVWSGNGDQTGQVDTSGVFAQQFGNASGNSAPTVANPIADQNATEDAPFSFTFASNTFDDADGDSLTYTATLAGGGSLPAWLTFDQGTRTFSGTPSNGDVGSITIRVTADDRNLNTVVDEFVLTIDNSNDAPTVANTIADQTATQDVVFNFQFAANTFDDVDGDTLTYTATLDDSSALPGWLNFDAATKTFSGTPADADVGVITVRVTADDGNGGAVFEDFTITVNDVNDAPTVTLTPIVNSLAEDTDTSTAIVIATINVDDDALGTETLTLTGDDALFFEIDGNNLQLKAGVALDFDSNPSLDVTVNVDDLTISGTPDDSDSHAVTITDVNSAPTDITLTNSSVDENEDGAVIGSLGVTDPDLVDTHVYSVDDARFEVIGTVLKLKAGDSLVHATEPTVDIIVTVTDRAGTGQSYDESFTITVNETLIAPIPLPPPPNDGGTPAVTTDSGDESSSDDSDESETEDESNDVASEDVLPGAGAVGAAGASQSKNATAVSSLTGASAIADLETESISQNIGAYFQAISQIESGSSQTDTTTSDSEGSVLDENIAERIRRDFVETAQADILLMSRPGKMWDQLDEQKNFVEQQIQGDLIVIGSTGAAASGFTVGVVAWALRSGFLVSGLMAQMPLYRAVDPLLIMGGNSATAGGETLAEMMDRQRKELDE